ncbi:MAG: hypothetical protein GTO14_22375 [Anaerolineales bacterium]|nr:hypothetical protein [Anaerolineales bacterium]
MALDLPAVSAVVARLPNAQINLAAWGGVVFPLALLIESPIMMLLAASTALSKDWDSFCRLRRYMMWMGGGLTALHALIAFTPMYDVVAVQLIGAPAEIVEPARLGLRMMLPWTWSIAFRRFHQGVLIRFGHSQAVGAGTVIRLLAEMTVLIAGLLFKIWPGIAVAGAAISAGVLSEALYAGLRVRPVLRDQVRDATPIGEPLMVRSFLQFYIPLAMTSLLLLLTQPIGSAALSRMPLALESLAVWPVITGFVFLLRSPGVAFNEVVVAMLDEPDAVRPLKRFSSLLMACATGLLILVAASPLAKLWFEDLSSLEPTLAALAGQSLWFAFPLPALSVLQSWYQGVILNSRRTRAVTEAVAISLIVISFCLVLGVIWGQSVGLYVGWLSFSLGTSAQVAWLWWRSRGVLGSGDLQDALARS